MKTSFPLRKALSAAKTQPKLGSQSLPAFLLRLFQSFKRAAYSSSFFLFPELKGNWFYF